MTLVYALAMGALVAAAGVATIRARAGALLSAAGSGALVVVGMSAALGGSRPVLHLGTWLGFGDSALRADGTAGIFLALCGITAAATALAYAEGHADRRLTALHCALAASTAIAIGASNAYLFFLAWELLTVTVYLLATGAGTRDGLRQALLAGGLSKLGGGALLAALALLWARTGTLDLLAWGHAALPTSTRGVLFALFVCGFATKIGLVPLQGALPAGYRAAPRAAAASISVALAAGFYGLWRFVLEIAGPLPVWCGDALLAAGALTASVAILYALTEDDIRGFLGFSTVEHSGIALIGFAVALLGQSAGNRTLAAAGLLAATLHVIAHGISKTLALLVADRVQSATGERAMRDLGGLARRMPAAAGALGAASLTLAAIPPLGGFVSEWFTFEALLQGFRMPTLLSRLLCALAAAALALTAGLGLLAFAKLFGFTALGAARGRRAAPGTPERSVPASLLLLGVPAVVLGVVAPWEIHLLGSGLQGALGFDPAGATITHPLTLGPVFADFSVLAPTWLALVLTAFTAIGCAVAWRARRGPARRAGVWITGSGAALDAVQYRPAAYSNPVRVVLSGILGFSSRLRRNGGNLVLERRVMLALDSHLYDRVAAVALVLAANVRRLQSGRLSSYLLYLLVVLIVTLVLVPVLR